MERKKDKNRNVVTRVIANQFNLHAYMFDRDMIETDESGNITVKLPKGSSLADFLYDTRKMIHDKKNDENGK